MTSCLGELRHVHIPGNLRTQQFESLQDLAGRVSSSLVEVVLGAGL